MYDVAYLAGGSVGKGHDPTLHTKDQECRRSRMTIFACPLTADGPDSDTMFKAGAKKRSFPGIEPSARLIDHLNDSLLVGKAGIGPSFLAWVNMRHEEITL